MKAKVIQIGNSKGIRIPKNLLAEFGDSEEVYMEATRGSIVIKPARHARYNWAEKFKEMAKNKDDVLIKDSIGLSSWDDKEWRWK